MHQPFKNGSAGVDDYGATVVTGKELADVLGLSETHIFTLKRRNIIQAVRARKSEYRLGESVRAYIAYKCATDSESQADFHRERALKERANRELREILLEQTKSQLHRAADVAIRGRNMNNAHNASCRPISPRSSRAWAFHFLDSCNRSTTMAGELI
jgi:hypothetical protein